MTAHVISVELLQACPCTGRKQAERNELPGHPGRDRSAEEIDMGMRISSNSGGAAASQSSVAQWQSRQPAAQPAASQPSAAPKPLPPTATLGNHVNVVA
jgi:hypothetical protein